MAAHTDNDILIDAPLATVWRIANDVRGWPELFEGEYAAAEVLQEDAERITFRLTTVPDDQGRQWSWVSERVMDAAAGTVTARRITTGPFLHMHIFQSFEQVGDRTRLRWVQDFEVLPTAPFTDEQMAARINGNSRVQLARHKRIAESAALADSPGAAR